MPDSVLDILKIVLLVMLYLFFARVLFAVWSEVRQTASARNAVEQQPVPPVAPAVPAPNPAKRDIKPMKGRGAVPGRLVVLEPKNLRGTAYAISGVIGIGRESDNTIAIGDDTYLSGHHAKVSLAEGRVIVDDLMSRNGTYLNGSRITEPRTVKVGDRIQIGYTVFEAQ
jgi:pSer/pThr/pTyr-binding forkhead associated (FHA) protein